MWRHSCSFNPLVGIPVVHATSPRAVPMVACRVSIPWSGFRSFTHVLLLATHPQLAGFNPLVGIPVVHATRTRRERDSLRCFNPLVGIPVVHARRTAPPCVGSSAFQSPGRDSGRSRVVPTLHESAPTPVSIPWSGFRSFTQLDNIARAAADIVSIPWSGFRSFTPERVVVGDDG